VAAIERIEADVAPAGGWSKKVTDDSARRADTLKHIEAYRARERRRRGWSELSARELAAKSDPEECLKARKARNKRESRAKAGVKPRAEYLLAAAAAATKPWEAAGVSRRTWYRRRTVT
jgi:hypothetical protein